MEENINNSKYFVWDTFLVFLVVFLVVTTVGWFLTMPPKRSKISKTLESQLNDDNKEIVDRFFRMEELSKDDTSTKYVLDFSYSEKGETRF
ncbi:Hypothetical protein CINCED_3A011184 [Cinara cedri]|uniref:Uncharacterized protein n=1 Tax=Cinara cedri TaxID=506608 RepID=A0A5E4NF07_9HEMI|nr:Hypothetical protein CINCED_3A011184 [Cinara cedri]